MRKNRIHPPVDKYPKTFETFQKIGNWKISDLTSNEPSCFNGCVSIKKYRVTVEEVDEPKEVLIQRLTDLWEKCDNHHHWQPLRAAASQIGTTLDINRVGINRKTK